MSRAAPGALTITGIGSLETMTDRGTLADAALVCLYGRVAWVGPEADLPEGSPGPRIDVGGRCVVPGFVDSHTHLVFAGDRSDEFAARLAGRPYEPGGILRTVAATRGASTNELHTAATARAAEALRQGTTTLEVKSGYGLTARQERRLLDVAATLPGVRATTFLGAHIVAPEYAQDPDGYVRLVTGKMLDACAPRAGWIDCFCEEGAFDVDEASTVLRAGAAKGLGLRLHTNQLRRSGGVLLAAELGAASVDHCTHLDAEDVTAIADAGMVATLLPTAEQSTRSPWAPARLLLEAGAMVALATDCNPGTSYTTSMPYVIGLACAAYGLHPQEALRAATLGGAAALRLADAGFVDMGARADLVIIDAPSALHLAYRPGTDLVAAVVRSAEVVHRGPAGRGV